MAVAGNHDRAAVGLINSSNFNDAAREAADWTADQLNAGQREFLTALPMVLVQDRFTLIHGSLRASTVEYLLYRQSAEGTLAFMDTQCCFVRYSHIPFVYKELEEGPDFFEFTEDGPIPLGDER